MRKNPIGRYLAGIMAALLSFFVTVAARAGDGTTATQAPALELVTLGSGGPGALGRAGSSHVILIDGVPRILVDAGPDAFVRLGEARLPLDQLDIVLITHLHADHVGDLPGLIKARAASRLPGPAPQRLRVASSIFEIAFHGVRKTQTEVPTMNEYAIARIVRLRECARRWKSLASGAFHETVNREIIAAVSDIENEIDRIQLECNRRFSRHCEDICCVSRPIGLMSEARVDFDQDSRVAR